MGQSGINLKQQIDYYGKLTAQFPIASMRVVYSNAGAIPAATILHDKDGIVENKLLLDQNRYRIRRILYVSHFK